MKNELTAKEQIIELLQSTERPGIDDLIDYLETSDFFIAPASTKYHGSFTGGLAEHCLKVLDAMLGLYEHYKNEYPIPEIEQNSIIIVAILHDLCKINTYVEDYKNQKVYSEKGSKQDNGGKFDWEVVPIYRKEVLMPMGHGGKSVFIAQNFITLTVEEAQAIYWHMGAYDTSVYNSYDEMGSAYTNNFLAFLILQADLTSTYILENKNYSKQGE